ncbi:MAG: radical SAM protein [Nitrospirae bacterium]|nr:radical SAM protein [Nitrospirota bacterium]
MTPRCNYRCSWCCAGIPDGALQKGSDLTVETMRAILLFPFMRKAVRMGLIGGEVFLHKDIFTFIEMARKAGLVTSIFSNGSLIADLSGDIYRSGLSFLGLSCYDRYYERLSANIERYQSKVFGRANPPILCMQRIMTSENYRTSENIIRDAIQLHADVVFLQNYYPVDNKTELCLYEDNLDYLSFKNEMGKKYGGKINIIFPGLLSRGENPRHCRVLFQTLMFDAEGRAQMCCYTPPDEKYGNIMKDPNLWNSDIFMKLRMPFVDHTRPIHPICTNCYASFADHRAI